MSKLIYAHTSALAESTFTGINNPDQTMNEVYRSVAFTGDGYMYTHGKKFRLFNVDNAGLQGISFSAANGTVSLSIDGATIGSGDIIQSITGDGIVIPTTQNGATALTHKTYISSPGTYGANLQIPIITVDAYGHISAVSNGTEINVTKVQASPTTTLGTYYLTGVTNANLQNPVYHTGAYFDNAGNIYATNFYLNGSTLSTIFAPLAHTSVLATDQALGHVYLYDTYDSEKDIQSTFAATPKAVYAALTASKAYTDSILASQDAMVFVGTITHQGVITNHNSIVVEATDNTTNVTSVPYNAGWTFRFTSAGTFQGIEVEVGDMLIAVKDRNEVFDIDDWSVIQTNISGALTASSLLNGILYANNSRAIQSLALSNGVLTSNGSTLSFVNKNTLWRDIQVKGDSIGTNTLNLKQSGSVTLTVNNGEVTIGVNASDIISGGASLTLVKGNTSFVYQPSANATLNVGSKLTLRYDNDDCILEHESASVITGKLGKITTDGYGHISSIEEVTSLKNPNAFKIQNANSDVITYDGSDAAILKVVNGTDVNLTLATSNGVTTLTPSITHKYRPVQFLATASSSPTNLINTGDSTTLTLVGGENVSLRNTASNGDPLSAGTLVIDAEDTWRAVEAYKFVSNVMSRSSIGVATLKFSNNFIWTDNEIDLCWTEIDEEGRVTYVK